MRSDPVKSRHQTIPLCLYSISTYTVHMLSVAVWLVVCILCIHLSVNRPFLEQLQLFVNRTTNFSWVKTVHTITRTVSCATKVVELFRKRIFLSITLFIMFQSAHNTELNICSITSVYTLIVYATLPHTFALHLHMHLTLPWATVDDAIEKRSVCNYFQGGKTDHPLFLLSVQRDLNWFWIIA